MDEVNVDAVDIGHEHRQCIEPRLNLPPVVLTVPIVRELLHRRELNALCAVTYEFPTGPSGRLDAPSEIGELFVRCMELERPYRGVAVRLRLASGNQAIAGNACGRWLRSICPLQRLSLHACRRSCRLRIGRAYGEEDRDRSENRRREQMAKADGCTSSGHHR